MPFQARRIGRRATTSPPPSQSRSSVSIQRSLFRQLSLVRWGLIPSWAKDPSGSASICFEVNDGSLFAFAGLWDRWKDPTGTWVKSCSILTTVPNAVTSAVHDRMPVILDPSSHDLWLDPGMTNTEAACDLLKPCDARITRCYPVSAKVNSVANDGVECSIANCIAPVQTKLFS
jgi:putative SOS response-associated peptidase YedK